MPWKIRPRKTDRRRQPRIAIDTGDSFEWRAVPSFPAYRVSRGGLVASCLDSRGRTTDRWLPLRPSRVKDNYLMVHLSAHGSTARRYVAHLVLEAFVGPRPDGAQCCHHPDPTPSNNRLENLRWDSFRANVKDRMELDRVPKGEGHHATTITGSDVRAIRALSADGIKGAELARRFGVTARVVYSVLRGETWSHVA